MTLIAGLLGAGCGVMLADSQETIQGYAKKSVNKLEYWGATDDDSIQFAIGGAADNGPYLDTFNFALQGALHKANSSFIGDIERVLEEATIKFHQEHVWPHGRNAPVLESLIMYQPVRPTKDTEKRATSGCQLIYIHQTAVIPLINDMSKSIGIGSYLADYVAARVFGSGCDEQQLLAVAVYILKQVKLNIDGVGLNGRIVLFPKDGEIQEYEQNDFDSVEKVFDEFDSLVSLAFHKLSRKSWEEDLCVLGRELNTIKSDYTKAVADIPKRRKAEYRAYLERMDRLGV